MTPEILFPLGWMHYLAGGLLIGGMSSFFTTTISYVSRHRYFHQARFIESRQWRLVYAMGLVLGAATWFYFSGAPVALTQVSVWQLVLGGFIAGFGARLSGGCTSGHGICGMASIQLPSILAVIIFLGTGMLTAHLARLVGGA